MAERCFLVVRYECLKDIFCRLWISWLKTLFLLHEYLLDVFCVLKILEDFFCIFIEEFGLSRQLGYHSMGLKSVFMRVTFFYDNDSFCLKFLMMFVNLFLLILQWNGRISPTKMLFVFANLINFRIKINHSSKVNWKTLLSNKVKNAGLQTTIV